MGYTITEFEETPNPNAVKCWLDRPISAGPKSFLNAEMAADDPIAAALFAKAGATTVLFNGDWVTVNKSPEKSWRSVKAAVKRRARGGVTGGGSAGLGARVWRLVAGGSVRGAGLLRRPLADVGSDRSTVHDMSGRESACDTKRAAALEAWFRQHARTLPWRGARSGYSALVAEAMLQQTQVSRVLEHYESFMRRFPDAESLAAASEQEVLARWQGLGYYRRAKNLHAAARMIVDRFGGRVPETEAELRRLPGVGRYTAGAIASIVFGARAPIVDGNVQRVLARWSARATPPAERDTVAWHWHRAEALVKRAGAPGCFNEAMMELGATLCTPRAPDCAQCPVARWCQARQDGNQETIPPPRPAPVRQAVHHHAVIVVRAGKVLLEQRPGAGLWSSMWQMPTIESPRPLATREVEAALPIRITGLCGLASFDHHTTHRHIRFYVYRCRSRSRRGVWRDPTDVGDLPMSNAHKKVLRAMGG